MSKKNIFFGNLIHSHNRDHFTGDIQLHGSFNLNFWTFPAKKKALLKLKKANLYSTAISSITAIFSCVQDNKQIKVIQWNLDIMNLYNYNKVLGITKYFLYPSNSKIYYEKKKLNIMKPRYSLLNNIIASPLALHYRGSTAGADQQCPVKGL